MIDRNELEVTVSIIVMQVKDIVLKIENIANKSTDSLPTIMASVNNIQVLTSKTNEQNCPKKVIAFVLFLFLITCGSNKARNFWLLSWR